MVMWAQFRKPRNVLSIPWWIKYLEIGSRIEAVVIHLHPHVDILQHWLADGCPLFRLLTAPGHMKTGPSVFISHHKCVLKPV